MKRTFVSITLLAVVFSMTALAQAGAASPAAVPTTATPAGTAGGVKVGIIEVQQALVATNEGARDLEALQKKFEPKRTELQNLNSEVDGLTKQLQAQGDKMNEDARNTLLKNIEAKKKTLQRTGEDAQADYQQQLGDLMNRLMQKMVPVIDKYAKENGFGLLIDASNPQSPLVWAAPSVDVSKAIVDAYNAQSGVAPPPSAPSGAAKSAPGATTRPATTTPAAKPATPPKPQ